MTVSEFDCLATKYDRKNGHCTWRHKQKKIGSLYYMVVSANAGILQWELVLYTVQDNFFSCERESLLELCFTYLQEISRSNCGRAFARNGYNQ